MCKHQPCGLLPAQSACLAGLPGHNLYWGARYVLSESKDTLYVAFMGTKQRRDLIANASFIQEPVWPLEDKSDAAHAKVLTHFLPGQVPASATSIACCKAGEPAECTSALHLSIDYVFMHALGLYSPKLCNSYPAVL